MITLRSIKTILMVFILCTAFFQPAFAQDIDVLVTPDEVEIEPGGSIQLEVFAFTMDGVKKPIDIDDVKWRMAPDSIGTITDDGYFVAGKYIGKAEIEATIFIKNRKFVKIITIIIGRLPKPHFRVKVVPDFAVVPVNTNKQFKVVVYNYRDKKVRPERVRWEVRPHDLGTITDDGLFTAGSEVGQGRVVAYVQIDGLTFRGAAKVVVSPPASGAISGNVVDDDSGLPLEGAKIKAIRLGRIHWVGKAKTDADGNYVIEELIPGDYVLIAKAEGYIREFFDNTRKYTEATVLRIAEGDSLTDKNFGLNEGGKIVGTVVADEDSLPLPHAHVVAFLRVNHRITHNTLTGEDGSYIIDGLPQGTYIVKANAVGYKGEYYDDAHRFEDAELLNIVEGTTRDSTDFELATSSAILGVVKNSVDGTPIANARIRVFIGPVLAFHHKIYRETRTNENGEYIVQIRQGAYYVYASARGFNGEFYDDARNLREATMVHVFPDSHTVGIDFELTPRGAITGVVKDQVTGEPIYGALVEAFKENVLLDAANSLVGYRAKTDSSGKYLIENVPSGKYLVRAVAEGYLPEFFEESPAKDGAKMVGVEDGAVVEEINFTLEVGGAISGFVAAERDSMPIPRALVQVWGVNVRLYRRAYTHEDGKYRIGGLPTGEYIVQVIAKGYFPEYYNNVHRRKNATPVPVTAPAETDSIDFFLNRFIPKRGTIAGVVFSDEDHAPLEGAVIVAVSPRTRFPYITFTGPHGHYELTDLPPGKYFVFAWADGFIGEFYKDAHRFRNADPVFVHAGVVTNGIDFGLAPKGGHGIYAVSGQIVSQETNAPIEGILVQARADNEIQFNAVTDADGKYILSGLPAGTYKIEATGVGYADAYHGGSNADNAAAVSVGNGQDASGVNMSLATDNVTSVEDGQSLSTAPDNFDLFQNYPNPFNPETQIKYQLSELSNVTLKIFNVLGQEIITLVDKEQPAGIYSIKWDGKDQFGRQVASGIYIFQMKASDKFIMSKRMLLLK
ncbi:MAG: carboxypeptidase regulatory-like domain-containing protein [bacterium]